MLVPKSGSAFGSVTCIVDLHQLAWFPSSHPTLLNNNLIIFMLGIEFGYLILYDLSSSMHAS